MDYTTRTLYNTYRSLSKTPSCNGLFSAEKIRAAATPAAKAAILDAASARLGYAFPPLSATMFMNFKRTGNRVDYEDVYFGKRRALNDLVLGEVLEGKGRFLDDIINGIFSLCEESAWQLPPHNSYLRDTPQLLLPDADRPVLDLFACETGAQLATIYALLKPQLDDVSEFVTKRILSELEKRIMVPYLAEHFWWMGHDEEPMCNWTIWCIQNILLTAVQIPTTSSRMLQIIEQASASTDFFLKDYGEDGCCNEGAQYYHHAGLCLYLTIDLLNRICDQAFAEMWTTPKIRNIAEYICNVHVEDIYYINYADCSPIAGRCNIREYLFGKAVSSAPLMSFAALDFCRSDAPYQPEEINLSYRLLTLLYEQEVRDYAKAHPTQDTPRNIWYESVGIFIARDDRTCLSMKAGCNDDSHNHNDTGSPILYVDGQPTLIDVGVESYTKKTFSPQRYEIWSMQSGYHNLPTINGTDQLPGPAYAARKVRVNPQITEISMDLADAYPKESGILSYLRTVSFETRPDAPALITLTDHFSFADSEGGEVICNFMTYDKPVFAENILQIGERYRFRIDGVSDCVIEEIPVRDPRLQIAWKHEIYRIRFTVLGDTFSMRGI